MSPNYIFRSKRLGFRKWNQSDLDPYAEMNADEEVMKYFPRCFTKEESKAAMERFNECFAKRGYTFFAVDRLDENQFIGFIGLYYTAYELPFCPCTEIGWRLAKAHWANGFATEGAKACLDFAFNKLDLKEVYSWTATTNIPSENVMKKIGMEMLEVFNHPKVPSDHPLCPHLLYKIEK